MTEIGEQITHPIYIEQSSEIDGLPSCQLSTKPVSYPEAEAEMEAHIEAMRAGECGELLWFLEHPPLYTAGTGAQESDLLSPQKLPVFKSGRGGQFTYHGPGQRVVYVMLDLNQRGRDVRQFVKQLQNWIIHALNECGLKTRADNTHIGVWVDRPDLGEKRADKIAAIGIRLRKWISFHGISINLSPDLKHFSGIIPCGITDQNVTSLEALGMNISMAELDEALIKTFQTSFEIY
ncbi:MAG: lipoyl(octanoyl) transferase LipB [Pseudomonadota bacterium]|nr:lipoyl(octanoyl) transferase LipB [Pseudomonadota bacterium]